MKILFLTVDRSDRIAPYYDPMQAALAKLCEVSFIRRKLERKAGIWTKEAVKGERTVEPIVPVAYANTFDLIYSDAIWAYLTEPWEQIHPPKALFMVDQHGWLVEDYMRRAFDEFNFELFLVAYRDATAVFHPYLYDRAVQWVPLCVPPLYRWMEDVEKGPYALLTGSVNHYYPIRKAYATALGKMDSDKGLILPRPADGKEHIANAWPIGEDYVTQINRASLGLSCLSKFKYPILKTFEIPACGTALLSDYSEELGALGFDPDKNMIEVPEGMLDLKALIEHTLKRDDLEDIAAEGHYLVHTRHRVEVRAQELHDHLVVHINQTEDVCAS